jgi:pimeloyl-ACP methyl ester carboxylesterase
MASFVLVHGSGQNASSWSRVRSRLLARGHTVATPDLPKQEPAFRLEDHAAEIARAIPGPGTIIVGHSFSGAFLPLVPGVEECALLVYFAAVIPEPGKSVRDQFTEDPVMFHRAWIDAGRRWFDPDHVEELANEFLFHDCDAATRAWGCRSLEMIDTRPLVVQPCPLAALPEVPAEYVVALHDRTLSADWGRATSRRLLGCDAIEIDAGHCPHVSRVQETVALLEQLAARHRQG